MLQCGRSSSRLLLALACIAIPALAQDVLTFHNDVSRSALQPNETILTPSNVNQNLFGKLLYFPVSGDVYAQPLYVSKYLMSDGNTHNVLIVATENDVIYAFDANGNNPASGYLWKTSLLGAGETYVSSSDVANADISPNIGVTGTPVIDRTGGTVFVVAKSKTTGATPVFYQRLHALSLASGAEKLNGPTVIQATLPGTGDGGTTVSFNPLKTNQRAALLLAPTPNGPTSMSVFIAWASHGDQTPYHGWVIAYDATANITQQTGVWVDTPNGGMGGIWMGAAGLSTDGNGNIFAASGNGTFDGNSGGSDLADSLIKLTISSSGLALSDWFTPIDQSSLSSSDEDFGVGGPILLPAQSGAIPNLVVSADKSGRIYLLNQNNLGRFTANGNKDIQDFSTSHYTLSNLVFFNDALYLASLEGPLQSWQFHSATETLSTSASSTSLHTFGAGSNFSISANGSSNGVVWAIDYANATTGPAVLYAYDASNLANLLYTSAEASNNRDAGPIAIRFTAPTIANGFVYVSGRNAVMGYGPITASTPPAPAPSFSAAAGTYSTAQSVSLSDSAANATIYYTTNGTNPTIYSTQYSSPIAIKTTTVLKAIAVAQNCTNSSVASATYIIDAGPGGGTGSVAFASGFSGSMLLNGSAAYNGSRLSLTDGNPNEVSSAYFPAPVNVQSFVNDFTFQISKPVADGFVFVIQNSGPSAIGSVSTGGSLGYGPDPSPGTNGIANSVAIKFDIYNNQGEGTSSTGMYLNGASPTIPAINLATAGVNLLSGDVMHAHMIYNGTTLNVTITDTKTGVTATQSYSVNIPQVIGSNTAYVGFTAASLDGTASQQIIYWSYAPQPYYPAGLSSFNISLNGGATLSGTNLVLTNGVDHENRSAFFTAPMNIQEFTSTFNFQLLNPVGDGFTFAIVKANAVSLGGGGEALGYGGIGNSIAVKFDLYNNAGEGPDSTGLYTNGATPTVPAIDLSTTGINLHSGDVFNVQMTYNGTILTVVITDTVTKATATQSYTINIPSTIGSNTGYIGFTGGTGGNSSTQEIQSWTFSN